MLALKEFIKQYTTDDKPILKEFEEAIQAVEAEKLKPNTAGEDAELVKKIKEPIDTYVKPAVEMDGGNIEFRSFQSGRN